MPPWQMLGKPSRNSTTQVTAVTSIFLLRSCFGNSSISPLNIVSNIPNWNRGWSMCAPLPTEGYERHFVYKLWKGEKTWLKDLKIIIILQLQFLRFVEISRQNFFSFFSIKMSVNVAFFFPKQCNISDQHPQF